jgi:hypothetical protein
MSEAINLGIGLLFAAAGVSKMLRRRSMRRIVEQYRLLPSAVVGLIAQLLGPIEVVVGSALALSPWWPAAGVAWIGAAALLVMFSLAIASALARGLIIPCGCGVLLGDHAITPLILARNLVLLVVLCLAR